MACTSIDLTIDSALADPVIGAAMRADGVDPRRLETLLRTTARKIDSTRPHASRLAAVTGRACGNFGGTFCSW